MTTPAIKCHVTGSLQLDLAYTDPAGHAAAVTALTDLPTGTWVRVIVGPRTIHDLDSRLPQFFGALAKSGLRLHFDGTTEALESWLPAVRGVARAIRDNVDPLRLVPPQ